MPHTTTFVVHECLLDFGSGVHDERTVTNDGLIQRLPVEQQQSRVLECPHHKCVASPLQHSDFRLAHRVGPEMKLTLEHEDGSRLAFRQPELHALASLDPNIPQIDGAKRPRWACGSRIFARDDADRTGRCF